MNLVVEKATATKSVHQWVKAGLIIAISGRKSHLDPPKSSAQPGGAIKCTVDFFFKCIHVQYIHILDLNLNLNHSNKETGKVQE